MSRSNKTLQDPWSLLLDLPETAFHLVTQNLDQCSLACVAMTCSHFRHAVPATISRVAVTRPRPPKQYMTTVRGNEAINSFTLWLEQHSSRVVNLQSCMIDLQGEWAHIMRANLPCPQLRELHLSGTGVQLQPGDGYPGLLQICTGLTALSLTRCAVVTRDSSPASATIAALPQLERLHLQANSPDVCLQDDIEEGFDVPELERMTQLTHLSLSPQWCDPGDTKGLSQLSALAKLQHLRVSLRGHELGVPGGWPSQLTNLTCLDIAYEFRGRHGLDATDGVDAAEQFQHLSTFTALQDLSVNFDPITDSELSGIRVLPHLTRLALNSYHLKLHTPWLHSWACLTGLQSLELRSCALEHQALLAFTQLRALSLTNAGVFSHSELFAVVGELSLLTRLSFAPCWQYHDDDDGQDSNASDWQDPDEEGHRPLPAAAFTALTASTNLCCLELDLGVTIFSSPVPASNWGLFGPGAMYPHLRDITITSLGCFDDWEYDGRNVLLGAQQVQELCSCCPALDSLTCSRHCEAPSPTAYTALAQLSALTRLSVDTSKDPAVLMGVVAQLTGLKQLELHVHFAQEDDWRSDVKLKVPTAGAQALLQLTALTALQSFSTTRTCTYPIGIYELAGRALHYESTAHKGGFPNVWIHLLRHLLTASAACRQAVLQCSTSAVADPAEVMLAQLAATLAGELAAGLPDGSPGSGSLRASDTDDDSGSARDNDSGNYNDSVVA